MYERILIILLLILLPFPLTKHQQYQKSLTTAIMQIESSYNHKAVSKKQAIGLMQVRYSVWHKELKKEKIIKNKNDLFHPEKNIQAGTYILNKYLVQCNQNLPCTLAKYSGNSKNYYNKVMEAMD